MILKKIILTSIIILFLHNILFTAAPEKTVSQNDKIKAVFIYNFTKYIRWPNENSSENFIIGLYGKNNLHSTLEAIAERKKVRGRNIIIKQYSAIKNLEKCHVLFVSSSINESILSILKFTQNKSILTIGEIENFSNIGGNIGFILINGKIKFKMNLDSLKNAGLDAGSQLLKLAIIVKGGK